MPEEVTITGQGSKYLRLLVINDPSYQPEEWYAALRKRFLVTVAASIEEAVSAVRDVKVTCAVAFVGGGVAARAVSEAFEATTRVVFVRRDDVTPDDDLFMLTLGKTWLPTTATVAELIDRVTSI